MNIFKCRNGVLPGGLECIFRITRLDEAGSKKYFGCSRHGGRTGYDRYNLFPEHDPATGDAVYQQTNPTDPFKLGEIVLAWENLTGHQSGRNFDFRDFPADIHPQYSIAEHNHPTKSFLSEEDVGEVFGDDSPTLVHTGWSTEKFYKIPTVEVCQGGIYGHFDPKANMIMHPCLRSHIGIPGWINYTNREESAQKKELYIGFASDVEIEKFSDSLFKDKKLATKMTEAMLLVKRGHFINLWTLMTNNFVSPKIKREFMNKTSTESLSTIYRGKANLMHFCSLYAQVGRMQWSETVVDANGTATKITKTIHKDMVSAYKENILNWVLNYPPLKKIVTWHTKQNTDNRYWFIILLLKQARKDGILNMKTMLPDWLIGLIKAKHDPMVKVFNEMMPYSQLPAEYKDEYHVAQHAHLGTSPLDTINSLYPGMINIKKELLTDEKRIDALGWGQFLQILKVGRRWSMSEIRNAFEHFIPSWMRDDPSIFYGWLQNVADLSLEESETLSKEEHAELLKKEGRRGIEEPGPVQILEHGAVNFNHGEGGLSAARAFASNILNTSLDWEDWVTWGDWDVVKMPIGNWYEANAKVRIIRESDHETFWAMLATHGGLIDDRKEIEKILSDQTLAETLDRSAYEEALEASEQNVATMGSIVEAGLDGEDLSDLMCEDHASGTITHLDKGEGLWDGAE